MKKAIFGLHLGGPTTLSVTARNGSVKTNPVLTISTRAASGKTDSLFAGTGAWTVPLVAGDYIVQLDGEIDGQIDISLAPPAVLVSLAGPTSHDLTAWIGSGAITADLKDPWPPPIVATPSDPTAVVTLAGADPASWFNTVLAPLASVIGRGGDAPPPIHALLIGIDHYPEAPAPNKTLFHDLAGCVRDVLEVDTFLRERLGVPAEQITRLLSPLPGTAAPAAALPTYANIVGAWQRLIREVPPGEQIYIHYSGHGGRVKTSLPAIKGESARDEALAPYDVNDRAAGRYLRDVEIAWLLEQMSNRGQVSTIVVDACHAGGLTRGDAVKRSGDGDDVDARISDALGSAVAPRAELEATAQRSMTARDIGDAGWYFGPSSTAVVAACRQNEFAYEYAFDGHVRRGALTYFWLQTLEQRTASLTYLAAQRRIGAGIAAHLQGQTPVVIGDTDREVLGLDHVRPARAIPVHAVAGDQITLAAGMASLMRRGMRLAVAPPDVVTELLPLTGLPEVEVIEVGAASSIARRVGDNAGPIVAGAQAIPLRYTDSVTRFVKWSPSGLAGDGDARAALEQAIAADRSKLVAAGTDGVAAHYFATVTAIGGALAYRIDDARGVPVPRLGSVIGAADQGAARVVARIAHLARFATVQTLDNSDPRSPLAGRLELELLALADDYQPGDTLAPRPFPGGQPERLAAGTWFCLRLRNTSPFELGAVVLDLQPDWGISRAVPSDSPWLQLAPGDFVDTPMRCWLPDGYDSATDTLKAIATIEPTSFDWLCLDPLDDQSRRGAKGLPGTDLARAMEAMRSATHAARQVAAADVPTRAWTTVQHALTVEALPRDIARRASNG